VISTASSTTKVPFALMVLAGLIGASTMMPCMHGLPGRGSAPGQILPAAEPGDGTSRAAAVTGRHRPTIDRQRPGRPARCLAQGLQPLPRLARRGSPPAQVRGRFV
jgi:hypothetical protein